MRALAQKHQWTEALAELRTARALPGSFVPEVDSAIGRACADKGDRTQALKVLSLLQGNRRKSFIPAYAARGSRRLSFPRPACTTAMAGGDLSRAWPPPRTARRDTRDARHRGVGLQSAAQACGVCQGAPLLRASIDRRPPPKATSKADQHARFEGLGLHCTLRKPLKSHLAVTMLDYRCVTSQHVFNGY